MKSQKDIQREIDSILATIKKEKDDSIEQKQAVILRRKKRIQFLKLCISYVNSNPTKEYLSSEKERVENRITVIETSFNKDSLDPSLKVKKTRKGFASKNDLEVLKDYRKLMGIPALKEQLKSITFLLN